MKSTLSDALTTETASGFRSMVSLRLAHRELLTLVNDGSDHQEFARKATAFMLNAKQTGRVLNVMEDRRIAQSLLDYWFDVLQRSGVIAPDATLAAFDRMSVPELAALECPYRGMDAFQEEDQRLFYGRHQLTNYLIRRLNDNHLLALVGPSGSGKSSLVMAGLLPSLRDGALEDSRDWRYCQPVVPGSDPLANLVQALYHPNVVNTDTLTILTGQLRQEPDTILELLAQMSVEPAVVFVDQFEEIFTLCSDCVESDNDTQQASPSQMAFVNCLMAIIASTNPDHRVIVALRSDYEPKIGKLLGFKEKFDEARIQVTPMSIGELRDAIIQPAQLVGLQINSRVVEAVASNVLGEQAALPLLQFTLHKLWKNRDLATNQITWDKYVKIRAGREALCDTAEKLYDDSSDTDRGALKSILVSMVEFDQTLTAVGRLIPVRDLFALDNDRDLVNRVVERLVQSDLVRLKRGSTADDDRIELAHEALIRDWRRLRDWSEEKREPVAQRLRLRSAADDWKRNKEDKSYLYTGAQLDQVTELHYQDLTPAEDKFISESKMLRDRQKNNKKWLIVAFVGLIALLFLSVSRLALLTYKHSRESAFETAAMLVGDADEVMVSDPALGLLLSAEAADRAFARSWPPLDDVLGTNVPTSTVNSLLDVAESSVAGVDLPQAPGRGGLSPRIVAFSPNTRYIAIASSNTGDDAICSVQLWYLGVDQTISPTLPWYRAESDCEKQQIAMLLFDQDSTRLLIVKTSGVVDVIELNPGEVKPRSQQSHLTEENISETGSVLMVSFSPTWRWMVTANTMGRLELQKINGWQGGEIISHTLATHGVPVVQTVFSPNEKWLVSVDISNTLELWNLMDLRQPPSQIPMKGNIIRFDPRSRWLAVASTSQPSVFLRGIADAGAEPSDYLIEGGSIEKSINSMAFQQRQDSTGELFAVGYDNGTIRVWNLGGLEIEKIDDSSERETGQTSASPEIPTPQFKASTALKTVVSVPVEIYEHSGAVDQLTFSASEANRLMSASTDGRVRILEISNGDYELMGTQYGRERPFVTVIFDSNRPGHVIAIDGYTLQTWREKPIPSNVLETTAKACDQAGRLLTPWEKQKYLEESKEYMSACYKYSQSRNSDNSTEVSK